MSYTAFFAGVKVAGATQLNEQTAEEIRGLLLRYYNLLGSMGGRFDISQLRMQFQWRDAFTPTLKQARHLVVLPPHHPRTASFLFQGESDLGFERASVLYNYAATLSYFAITQVCPQWYGVAESDDWW